MSVSLIDPDGEDLRGRKLTEVDKRFLANLVVQQGQTNSIVAKNYNLPHSTVSKYVKAIRNDIILYETSGQPKKNQSGPFTFRKSKRKALESMKHIKTKRQHYNTHISSRGDSSLFANYIDENCIEIASDGEIKQGIHNISNSYTNDTRKDESSECYDRTPESVIVDDMDTRAVERGRWKITVNNASGNPTHQTKGHYQAGWKRKEDGEWRIISEHFVQI